MSNTPEPTTTFDTTTTTTTTLTPSNLSQSPTPAPPSTPQDPEYELLLLTTGTITSRPPSPPLQKTGRLQVLQRKLPPPATDYIAILSVDDVNVPLGIGHRCDHGKGLSWDIELSGGEVVCVECTGSEEDGRRLEEILRWFMKYEGKKEGGWAEWIEGLGVRGEEWVGGIGDKAHGVVLEKLCGGGEGEEVVEVEGGERERRNVKLGGRVTRGVLGGARWGSEKGARVAHVVTEKVSDTVGGVLGGNPVVKHMREAPAYSKRHRFHKLMTAGMMAIGRVYLKADEKGKVVIETAGDGLGKKAGEKYGDEAEKATRDLGRIGLNSYRIVRFPNKLGASALLKGALKGAMKDQGQKSQRLDNAGAVVGAVPFPPQS